MHARPDIQIREGGRVDFTNPKATFIAMATTPQWLWARHRFANEVRDCAPWVWSIAMHLCVQVQGAHLIRRRSEICS
jgi:hypothetical protein